MITSWTIEDGVRFLRVLEEAIFISLTSPFSSTSRYSLSGSRQEMTHPREMPPMRYVLSCLQCEFASDATDLRGLGLQLNRHAASCHCDPILVLKAEQDHADLASEVADETLSQPIREVPRHRLCA